MSAAKKGLGRGLGALIDDFSSPAEEQQITKDRLSSILKECGFAPLRDQEEFDRFVIGFLQNSKSASYLVEQVLAYAQEERNFFLYKTWLNSDSAYERMTKLLK